MLRRGTEHELVRVRSKPPPIEEKLIEEGKLILKESALKTIILDSVIQEEESQVVEPKVRDLDVQMIMKESGVKKIEDFSIDSWKNLQGILKNNLIIAKNGVL